MALGQVITDWFSYGYGEPTTAPDLNSNLRWALYQDSSTGEVWFWNLLTNAWELLVAAGGGVMPLSIAVVNYTGADISFTNSSWTLLDSAFSVTMTTGNHRVLVMTNFCGQSTGGISDIDVYIDGVGTGYVRGVWYNQDSNAGPMPLVWLSPVLGAGSHTIALYAKAEGGAALGIGAGGPADTVAQMMVLEQAS